jgi:hypothetical protein|tara:strand:+ start:57 stop:518 length:462 start_codon:yes stop_codon:yes gene_type:complete
MTRRKFGPRQRAIAKGYRSGLEEKVGEQLKKLNVDAEYESFKIPYTVPVIHRTYTPDYLLPNGIVLELKGLFVLEDRKKHLLIKEQYPNLDIRFVFSNSRTKLRKGAKSNYGEWCEKHGFTYADKEVPNSWVKEKSKLRSINIVERLKQEQKK